MQGKILFYNPQTGEGKIILQNGNKFNFNAEVWDDFDVIPQSGGVVACTIKGDTVVTIKADSDKKAYTPPKNRLLDEESVESASGYQKESGIATFGIKQTIQNYFKPIDAIIGEPPEVVNTKEQLNYFMIKRFLFTAYNDLQGLDRSMHKNEILKSRADEIRYIEKAHRAVKDRLDSPKLAFEIIFLRSQPEYLRFIRHKEQCLSRITILTRLEESLFPDIQNKEEAFKRIDPSDTKLRETKEEELKALRKHYVDTIHENAKISHELTSMEDIKEKYANLYYEKFTTILLSMGGQYLESLAKILNYRAFSLDKKMWEEAQNSKVITEYFRSSDIEGGYSTLTFLRYYLKRLDQSKVQKKHKELFELLEYLQKRELQG